MAVFKCKMCGGTLEISEGMTVCECEYCGTTQTLTTSKDENTQGLFNRANFLRMKSEFDKAEQLYEKLVQSDPNDAEAHWGLILCKFGIEYVEDPATLKRVPTCHRTSFDSIIADEDYKEALRCADTIQRGVYEAEAKEIDRLQKEILALSAKEEPYDVFICYKESDGGSRTPDSVIANDIYHQLTNEGFKVFYAAITLEDKLGSAYEPCIFAALNSAKVMLAIGTKPEYINAVWVKNEWSRFLKMMKKDRTKLLIPCYKDMDAYELPEEFAHLQAQDMSKIGFISDLVRGIKKVVRKEEPKPAAVKAPAVAAAPSVNPTTNSLMKRAFIFLEDGDWQSADEYCEKVLDLDPENGEAYLGKLMTELKVRRRSDLEDQAQPFDNSSNYQRIIRYGSDALIAEVRGCNDHIKKRNLLAYQESTYEKATAVFNNTRSKKDEITEAKKLFETISGYKDADKYLSAYDDRIKEVDYIEATGFFQAMEKYEKENPDKIYLPKTIKVNNMIAFISDPYNEKHVKMIKGLFEKIPDYKDSAEYIKKCDERIALRQKQKKQNTYDLAGEKLTEAKAAHSAAASPEQYQKAIELFDAAELSYQDIKDFQDSDARIQECENLIAECKEKKRGLELAAQQAAEAAARAAARKKKITAAVVSAAAIIAAAAACLIIFVVIPETNYNNAVSLKNEGKYDEAINAFESMNGYKDSTVQIEKCQTAIKDKNYENAVSLMNEGKFDEAINAFETMDGYKDSDLKVKEIYDQHEIEILKSSKVGDYVVFGSYEQDNDLSNGKEVVEWLVLAKEDDKALVISRYALECQQYHTSFKTVTWKTCSLRKWLNETFINNAFNTDEQSIIEQSIVQTTIVMADEDPSHDTYPGINTKDKVFLLSIPEVNKYFRSDEARKCESTDYAIAQGVYTDNSHSADGKATCWWWLRSPAENSYRAAEVDCVGEDDDRYGSVVNNSNTGVRPAMWINLGA